MSSSRENYKNETARVVAGRKRKKVRAVVSVGSWVVPERELSRLVCAFQPGRSKEGGQEKDKGEEGSEGSKGRKEGWMAGWLDAMKRCNRDTCVPRISRWRWLDWCVCCACCMCCSVVCAVCVICASGRTEKGEMIDYFDVSPSSLLLHAPLCFFLFILHLRLLVFLALVSSFCLDPRRDYRRR